MENANSRREAAKPIEKPIRGNGTGQRPSEKICRKCGRKGVLHETPFPGQNGTLSWAVYYAEGDTYPFHGEVCATCYAEAEAMAQASRDEACNAEFDAQIPEAYREATLPRPGDKDVKVSAVYKWAEDEKAPLLTLTGPVGSGKTWLAWAVARHVVRYKDKYRDMNKLPRFWSIPELSSEIRERWRSHDSNRFIKNLRSMRALLILDDVGTEAVGSWFNMELFRILDYRLAWQLKTVVTTNLTRAQIVEILGAPIASRIAGGVTLKIDRNDLRGGDEGGSEDAEGGAK